jgi:hypothetical protein
LGHTSQPAPVPDAFSDVDINGMGHFLILYRSDGQRTHGHQLNYCAKLQAVRTSTFNTAKTLTSRRHNTRNFIRDKMFDQNLINFSGSARWPRLTGMQIDSRARHPIGQ